MNIQEIPIAAKSDRRDGDQWLPLWMHANDCAGMMEWLWDKWLPEAERRLLCADHSASDMKRLCRFLGLIHDIGKATPGFQREITAFLEEVRARLAAHGYIVPALSQEKTPHALAGEAILRSLGCHASVAAVVGAHHGKPQSSVRPASLLDKKSRSFYGTQKALWSGLWQALLQSALAACGWTSPSELPVLSLEQQILLSGLLIMADWIASNPYYFPLISTADNGSPQRYPARVKAGWDRLALPGFWQNACPDLNGQLFFSRFGFAPNPVQQLVIDAASAAQRPGIFIVEAQMGVGKTEAALAAAEMLAGRQGRDGVFFGLPTQATANGIFPRLAQWARKQAEETRMAIRLAHGMAELNEDYRALFHGRSSVDDVDNGNDVDAGLAVHAWFQGRKLALLSNFVIGTVDQLLMSALKQKHVMLRHLGLAGKIVVVDEVHAYDAYMSQYLDMALTWLGDYGVPVILLSATLPAWRRRELVASYLGESTLPSAPWQTSGAYPLLTWTDGQAVRQETAAWEEPGRAVALTRTDDAERMELLSDALADGGCACVIMNTVARAQAFAEEVQACMPDFRVILFHAQFLMPDRAEVERELQRCLGKNSGPAERERLIVVGTQVLEQSLDIDADVMLTELCPMDLLLQRLGRLHRHRHHDAIRPQRLRQAQCYVLTPRDGSLERGSEVIYGQWPLLRTMALLPERLILPDDIPALVQEVYDETRFSEAERAAKAAYDKARRDARNKALVFRMEQPDDLGDQIGGWLDNAAFLSDARARAAVRDGDSTVEVIVLMEKDGRICFLPWQNGGAQAPCDRVPSEQEQRDLFRQRLKLPGLFCRAWMVENTILELERTTLRRFGEWQSAPLLRGELVLLLDENLRAELCGYTLRYNKELGLTYKKAK